MMNDKKYLIPCSLTFSNMTLGMIAVFLLLRPLEKKYKIIGALCILTGGLIDSLDGTVSRKLHASSEIGKQLDSFADLVTFGLAPIALLHSAGLIDESLTLSICALLYPLAGAFRLARYNLGSFSQYFCGVPITAAGLIVTLYGLVFLIWEELPITAVTNWITAGLLITLSLLMVSTLKVRRII